MEDLPPPNRSMPAPLPEGASPLADRLRQAFARVAHLITDAQATRYSDHNHLPSSVMVVTCQSFCLV